MVIHINPVEKAVEWRWRNMFLVGAGIFILSLLWRYLINRKERRFKESEASESGTVPFIQRLMSEPRLYKPGLSALAVFSLSFPFLFSTYQVNIMTTALMYAVLGLGLNIVVGLAGLLDLGYVAFYAVGAYSYGLLNHHFCLCFWTVLPVGALLGALFGILLGFPVLRLRGDYLAIVTLGFGEIIRKINAEHNTTIFLVEQNANLALQAADRGYVMENGSIVLSDTAENLLSNGDVKKAYLGL